MNISILLKHSRIWISEVNYEGSKSDKIVVGQTSSFVNLKSFIVDEPEIDEIRNNME